MKYKYIFLDVDNTILDFSACELNAHKKVSQSYNLPWNVSLYNAYNKINDEWWKKFERGECSKPEIGVGRFKDYLTIVKSSISPGDFNSSYLEALAEGRFVIDGANEFVKKLYNLGYTIYIATNGNYSVQKKRLENQAFMKYVSDVFISEKLGYPKPTKEFFEGARKQACINFASDTIIIGDSLTSDIKGGINAGFDTCWYNPNNLENTLNIPITYTVKSYDEILKILK